MKLLIQADDYGITRAVADGIIFGIQKGVIKNTGIFINMPWATECVEKIRPYLNEIAFGIDLNTVQGPSLLGYETVPSLCHEDGTYLSIKENKAFDNKENNFDYNNKEELYKEYKAHVERFIELVGDKPSYIHAHAYSTASIEEMQRLIAKEYEVPYSMDFAKLPNAKMPSMAWYSFGTPDEQLKEEPLTYWLEDKNEYLEASYGYLITHCGYVDKETMQLPFNLCRANDLYAITSTAYSEWLEKHHVNLITFKDIRNQI